MNTKMKKLFLGLFLIAGFISIPAVQADHYEHDEIEGILNKLHNNARLSEEEQDKLQKCFDHELGQEFLQGTLTATPLSLLMVLDQYVVSVYFDCAECHATAIRFFMSKGVDINKAFFVHEMGCSDAQIAKLPAIYKTSTFTPLMMCCTYGPVVRGFLMCGANPLVKNDKGQTVFDIIVAKKNNIKDRMTASSYCDVFYRLLQAVDVKNRHDLIRQHLPLFAIDDMLPFVEYYDLCQEVMFANQEYVSMFFLMLPMLENAQEFIQDYINSLDSEQERREFATKMQGYVAFLNSDMMQEIMEDFCDTQQEYVQRQESIAVITKMINEF